MKIGKIRFILTITLVRITTKILKLLGRNATHFPGWLANRLCPDFLGYLEKPERLVYITGTNGKTTVSNLVSETLKLNGYDIVNNSTGSNVSEGVVSALLAKSSFFGKARCSLGILEVDERYSPLIYPYMAPDYVVCTNLFRDSYKRNAHVEYIFGILNRLMPAHTKLILNGEDLISSHLAETNERCYFGINCMKDEPTAEGTINDMIACPKCGALLEYEYRRYNHIGRGHCPKCDFGSPEMDYTVESLNKENQLCQVKTPSGLREFKLPGNNITDAYNMIAAIALLSELGLSIDTIQSAFDTIKLPETRYHSEMCQGKELIMNLAKGQNPIACSRVFDFIRKEPGKKSILCMIGDFYDAKKSSENMAWIFDTDFEFLNQDSIQQIVVAGARNQDFYLRLLMAGVPEEKITCWEKEEDMSEAVNLEITEKIFILYDVYTIHYANQNLQNLKKRLERGEMNDDEN